ncbi:MAG: hypothetical protein PHW65_00975 [Dehalococcoidales bacterium]|nr:hypothetical protein [Dehalococcoidales bacterium]
MRISWLIGNQNWAYKNLMEHNRRAMPQFEHVANETDADVVVSMYPQGIGHIPDKKRAIMHLDSRRLGYREDVL